MSEEQHNDLPDAQAYERTIELDVDEHQASLQTTAVGRPSSLHRSRAGSQRASRAKAWSSSELRMLRELAIGGTPPEIIARTLRRTESAVRNKAGMHGISLRSRT